MILPRGAGREGRPAVHAADLSGPGKGLLKGGTLVPRPSPLAAYPHGEGATKGGRTFTAGLPHALPAVSPDP